MRVAPNKPQWSPALQKAAQKKRYWKDRWRKALDGTNQFSRSKRKKAKWDIQDNGSEDVAQLERR